MSTITTRSRQAPRTSARARAVGLGKTALETGVALGVFALAALASFGLPGYFLTVATAALVFAVVLISLVVLTGYVGQVSLCQASFMGLGAYLVGAFMGHYHLSYWVAAPLAVVGVFLFGVAVGLPALRLRGLTLAIVTLSLALLCDTFLFADVGYLNNNSNGWRITPPHIFNVALDTNNSPALYRVVLVGTALVVLAVVRLRRGRTGKSWFAMRDAEIAASTSGVPVVSMKLLGFGIAAAIAGFGGALYALATGSVSPDPFNFLHSIQLLAIITIAGVRSIPGAILGALFYIVLPQLLLQFPALVPLTSLILGAGLIVQIVFAPAGLGGSLEAAEARFFRWLAGTAPEPTPTPATRGGQRAEGGPPDATL